MLAAVPQDKKEKKEKKEKGEKEPKDKKEKSEKKDKGGCLEGEGGLPWSGAVGVHWLALLPAAAHTQTSANLCELQLAGRPCLMC